MPDQQTFREAWGKYASSVSVITCIEPGGGVHGMAASDISSVSLDPMLVLVCVGHNRNSFPLIKKAGRFALNIMGEDQSDIVAAFVDSAGRVFERNLSIDKSHPDRAKAREEIWVPPRKMSSSCRSSAHFPVAYCCTTA